MSDLEQIMATIKSGGELDITDSIIADGLSEAHGKISNTIEHALAKLRLKINDCDLEAASDLLRDLNAIVYRNVVVNDTALRILSKASDDIGKRDEDLEYLKSEVECLREKLRLAKSDLTFWQIEAETLRKDKKKLEHELSATKSLVKFLKLEVELLRSKESIPGER